MLVPLNVFSAMATIRDKESSRYALGGFKLERSADGSPVAIATDGHKLVAYSWSEPELHPFKPENETANLAFSALVSGDALDTVKTWKISAAALRQRSERGFVYIPESTAPDGAFSITATDGAKVFRIDNASMEGRFPKWRDCFSASYVDPDYADGDSVAITLDPRYVVELCQAAAKLVTTEDSRGVTFTIPSDPGKPALIRAKTAERGKFAAVLMPLRKDDDLERADSGQWTLSNRANVDQLQAIADKLAVFARQATIAEALADRLTALADSLACQAAAAMGDAVDVDGQADDSAASRAGFRFETVHGVRLDNAA